MKKLALAVALAATTSMSACAGKYDANWESLAKHNETPEWFRDAKFGIYFHWGPYSVPAYGNEHYPRTMYGHPSGKKPVKTAKSRFQPAVGFQTFREHEHHKKAFGDPSEFEYHDLIPLFKAPNFDAEEWADLFYLAGAKFAGPVAEHHDGFAMWDSEVTPWNAADMGPKRDIVGEMNKAIRKRGMKYITTFHHAKGGMPDTSDLLNDDGKGGAPGFDIEENVSTKKLSAEMFKAKRWWHYFGREQYLNRTKPGHVDSPEMQKLYGNMPREAWLDMWNVKLEEVIDQYQPDLIWFDSWLDRIPEKNRQEFAAYYLNAADKWGKDVAITYKQEDMPHSVGIEDFEKGRLDRLTEFAWLTDDTISSGSWASTGSWSYTEELVIREGKELLHTLIDIVSKNGQLLLNISPTADGIIPEAQRQSLLEMGTWLRANGEAIYNTRPFNVYGEGPKRMKGSGHFTLMEGSYNQENVRFTRNGSTIYALQLGWPGSEVTTTIKSISAKQYGDLEITNVSVVDSSEEIEWSLTEEGLKVTTPFRAPNKVAIAYKIETNGKF